MEKDENTSQHSQPRNKEKESVTYEMPWPAYSEAFQIQGDLNNDKNYVFLCKICIGKKLIHASKSSAANLKKHLQVNIISGRLFPIGIFIY